MSKFYWIFTITLPTSRYVAPWSPRRPRCGGPWAYCCCWHWPRPRAPLSWWRNQRSHWDTWDDGGLAVWHGLGNPMGRSSNDFYGEIIYKVLTSLEWWWIKCKYPIWLHLMAELFRLVNYYHLSRLFSYKCSVPTSWFPEGSRMLRSVKNR